MFGVEGVCYCVCVGVGIDVVGFFVFVGSNWGYYWNDVFF